MTGSGHLDATYFRSPAAFRRWLEKNHDRASELWVGYYKKGSGEPSLTWPESVREALCFGWIDGVRRGVDETRYAIRFTPRKSTSIWSANNVKHIEELIAAGLVHPAGHAAYAKRTQKRTAIYSFERETEATLTPEDEARFRQNKKAWAFWESQPPGYRKTVAHLLASAKKPETRERRLAELIADSANGLRIKALRR